MEIFVAITLDAARADRVRALAGSDGLHLHGEPGEGLAPPSLKHAEVVFGNLPVAWLASAATLRWMQLESVGFGEYLGLPPDTPFTLTNLAGFFSEPVAETALAGLLGLCRGIDRLALFQNERRWEGAAFRPRLRTLAGQHVVIFGHGAIGRRFAELVAPFGCRITSFGRDWSAEALDQALASADVVVGAVPDMPGTRDVFNRRRIGLLQPHAVLVNVGRGSLVDEEALVAALRSGRLGGAVLDVTREEPLPADHALWTCPNLILTQHTGGGTGDEIDRKIEWFAENLARYRRGEPLRGVVDLSRGY